MDLQELKQQFDEIARQAREATKSQPETAALINTMLGLFMVLFELLVNRSLSSKRAHAENINGRGSEKKKGIDSSDKNRKDSLPREKSSRPVKPIKHEHKESYIGYKGQEYTAEEAEALIGTVFEGDDGRKYKYTRKLGSSLKTDWEITLTDVQYYKLEYAEVDEQGHEVAGGKRETAVSAKTDFLKKTFVGVSLMSHILYLWICMKSPINRIATALNEYGLKLSKQQLYKDIGIAALMLRPVFEHLESYLGEEKQLCVDETYHGCREKQRQGKEKEDKPPENRKGRGKEQKSAAKTLRSYFYGIVGGKVCLYYHDLERNFDIPKEILLEHGIQEDAFVETDGFYRRNFNMDSERQLFLHGVCWVHAKRYLCVLLNYATTREGEPIQAFIDCKWEQDIEDAKRLADKISRAFQICNVLTGRCRQDSSLNLMELKNRELRPVIEDILEDARAVQMQIKGQHGAEPIRKSSKKLQDAIGYLMHNEEKLKTFLDSPYGLMHSTKVEEKFRELDILRNSMMLSDTCRGAENLALYYSLYKTAQMHHIEFETYMNRALTVMTENMDKIEFEKDGRGTIINYKSNNVPREILDSLMPWNMADIN